MEAGISRSRLGNGRNCASDPAMQLAESEKKAVEQVKKIEARWPKTRWIAMAIGVGWIAIGTIDIAISTTIPLAGFVLLGFGIPHCIAVLKIWSGRPTLKLRLKFAERYEEKSN
jgi:hypothetical protein